MFLTEADILDTHRLLDYLHERSLWLEALHTSREAWSTDLGLRLGAERALYTCVEATTDIGTILINALVMRDPAGYADILRVLVEEDVVSDDWFQHFRELVDFRADLIRRHARIESTDLERMVSNHLDDFNRFEGFIRTFISKETAR